MLHLPTSVCVGELCCKVFTQFENFQCFFIAKFSVLSAFYVVQFTSQRHGRTNRLQEWMSVTVVSVSNEDLSHSIPKNANKSYELRRILEFSIVLNNEIEIKQRSFSAIRKQMLRDSTSKLQYYCFQLKKRLLSSIQCSFDNQCYSG